MPPCRVMIAYPSMCPIWWITEYQMADSRQCELYCKVPGRLSSLRANFAPAMTELSTANLTFNRTRRGFVN